MNIAIICSKKDVASNNFFNYLIDNYNFKEIRKNLFFLEETEKTEYAINEVFLIITDQLHIYLTEKEINDLLAGIEKNIEQVIFLSRHSTLSEKKEKSISVHAIGNWKNADLGGRPTTVCKTDPILIRELLLRMYIKKKQNIDIDIKKYEVKQEATHHGPYLENFAIFVEIGSDLDAWNDLKTIGFICENVIDVLKYYNREKIKEENNWVEVVGFGGSHYCTKFFKYSMDPNKKYCFGHIIPDYAIKEFDKEIDLNKILKEALKKSNSSMILNQDLSIKKKL